MDEAESKAAGFDVPLSPPPTAKEVASRALILRYVAVYALIQPPQNTLLQSMENWTAAEREDWHRDSEAKRVEFWSEIAPLRDRMSHKERAFAETVEFTMTLRQQVDASWQVEAFVMMLWALGRVNKLPPWDEMTSHDLLKTFPFAGIPTVLEEAALRDHAEIKDARDMAEMWHWRARTRQLQEQGHQLNLPEPMKSQGIQGFPDLIRRAAQIAANEGWIAEPLGDDFPAFGKPYRDMTDHEWSQVRSISQERHRVLNWLCGYAPENDWDRTPTNT